MTEGKLDPVGQLLRERVISLSTEVSVPDWQLVVRQRPPGRQNNRISRVILIAGAAFVAAIVAVAVIVLPRTGSHYQARAHHVKFGNYILAVRDLPLAEKAAPALSGTHLLSRTMPLKTSNYASIAFGAHSVWLLAPLGAQTGSPCGKLVRVNATSAEVTGSVPIRLCPAAVAYGDGSVWVLSFQIGVRGLQLTQVNPATFAIISENTIAGGRHGITPAGDTGAKYMFVAATNGRIFLAVQDHGGGEIMVVNASSRRVTRMVTIPAGDGPITAMGSNSSYLWAGTANGWILALDPATGIVHIAKHLGTYVVSVSASAVSVWISVNLPVPSHASYPGLDILRLDPSTGALEEDTGLPMTFVATDGSSVWALGSAPPYASEAGLVVQIDPANGAILHRVHIPAPGYNVPDTIGVYMDHAWVVNDFLGVLTRVSP
jgi:hypothetical protein